MRFLQFSSAAASMIKMISTRAAESFCLVPEQRQQDDDWQGNADQPKQRASSKSHVNLLDCVRD
jgi:hypothetical protein